VSQSEGERADYQRNLAISRWRIGETENPADIKSLKRALAVLESLDSDGRLAAADEEMIAELKGLIANSD
jgi:hypothetical protein